MMEFYKETVQTALQEVHSTVIELGGKYGIKASILLDLGCSTGQLTTMIAGLVDAAEVHGVDISDKALNQAKSHGIITHNLDLNYDSLPFPENYFDLILAIDVIEHLVNTDNLLKEAFKVLKKEGYFIISTPNLASWTNGIALLLGYQPFTIEVSFIQDFGKMKFKWYRGHTSGHVRAYTLSALREQVKYYGFNIIEVLGVHTSHSSKFLTLIGKTIAKIPSLAQYIISLCQKT